MNNGPPTRIYVTVQDTGSGLLSILVTEATNATVTWPPFTPGTTSPVIVTGTKINQGQSSRIALRVTDVAGNITNCDPVVSTLRIRRTGEARETNAWLPRAESKVTLVNGRPGARSVRLVVNGITMRTVRLAAAERRTINVARAMRPGNRNRITTVARGRHGASVMLLISD